MTAWKLVTIAFLCGIALALGAMRLTSQDPPDTSPVERSVASNSLATEQRVARIETAIGRIETSIASLSAQIAALRASPPEAEIAPSDDADASLPLAAAARELVAEREQLERSRGRFESMNMALQHALRGDLDLANRLETDGGFPPARARQIAARFDELVLEAMELDQRQAKDDSYTVFYARQEHIEDALRRELGEADYMRYRHAARLPTEVYVSRVLSGSNAERAGLVSGDVIVAYDGRRVMELRKVQELAAQGLPGTAAVIEVVRDGQRMQLTVERGPLGVTELGFIGRIAKERGVDLSQ